MLVPSAEIEKAWGCKLQQLVIPFNTATATATAMSHVKVLFGAASFGSLPTETSQEFLDLLKKHNVKDLDTAYLYVSGRASWKIEDRS